MAAERSGLTNLISLLSNCELIGPKMCRPSMPKSNGKMILYNSAKRMKHSSEERLGYM